MENARALTKKKIGFGQSYTRFGYEDKPVTTRISITFQDKDY